MGLFVLSCIIVGCVGVILGVLSLAFRERVLSFVRSRYEKVYREDSLSEGEFRTRLPTMPAVIAIAIGFIIVGTVFVTAGLLAAA
jgi:hypothetical protein